MGDFRYFLTDRNGDSYLDAFTKAKKWLANARAEHVKREDSIDNPIINKITKKCCTVRLEASR